MKTSAVLYKYLYRIYQRSNIFYLLGSFISYLLLCKLDFYYNVMIGNIQHRYRRSTCTCIPFCIGYWFIFLLLATLRLLHDIPQISVRSSVVVMILSHHELIPLLYDVKSLNGLNKSSPFLPIIRSWCNFAKIFSMLSFACI